MIGVQLKVYLPRSLPCLLIGCFGFSDPDFSDDLSSGRSASITAPLDLWVSSNDWKKKEIYTIGDFTKKYLICWSLPVYGSQSQYCTFPNVWKKFHQFLRRLFRKEISDFYLLVNLNGFKSFRVYHLQIWFSQNDAELGFHQIKYSHQL